MASHHAVIRMTAAKTKSFVRRLPTPLKYVFWGAVAVAIYGPSTWLLGVIEKAPSSQTWVSLGPVHLPYLDPTATAGAILALGTAALAYAALRQAMAAEGLVTITRRQAASTQRQAEIAELQLQAESDRADAARSDALRADAVRRSESFPRIRIVTPTRLTEPEWTTVIPGNVYPQWSEPRLGIQNQGKGQAIDLRATAAWKVFDFGGAETASPQQLSAVKWQPVPQWIPPVDLLDPRSTSSIETVFWLSGFAVGSKLTKRIIALYVRASWTDPDGNRQKSAGAGLVLIPGAFHKAADPAVTETVDFLAIGPDDADAPSDAEISREPPLNPTGTLPRPDGGESGSASGN